MPTKTPAIPKNVRFPPDLYALIVNLCEKETKTFSEVVIDRTSKTFAESWEQTGNNIRLANYKIKAWEDFKLQKKKIRFKEIHKRKLVKLELKEKKRQEEEELDRNEFQRTLNDMKRIQDHLNGGTPIWISKNDPDVWLISDTDLDDDYRKLEKGKLNPELRDFYNENIQLLK